MFYLFNNNNYYYCSKFHVHFYSSSLFGNDAIWLFSVVVFNFFKNRFYKVTDAGAMVGFSRFAPVRANRFLELLMFFALCTLLLCGIGL